MRNCLFGWSGTGGPSLVVRERLRTRAVGIAAALALAPMCGQGQVPLAATPIPSTNYSVTERGANHRVWQRVLPVATNQQGTVTYHTNRYTELATGMHHLVGTNWVESSSTIAITPGGGAATNGQHQVYFAANLNASNAVEIVMPDGKRLRTHVLGLSYFDSAAGSNVLIAELQDSLGELVRSNQVLYSNAFSNAESEAGSIQADVRYTFGRIGIEQDVILRQQLPSPGNWGLSPETTELQVWTEFLDPPEPTATPSKDGTDVTLDFGTMRMIRGRAFLMGDLSSAAPTSKRWISQGGRTFLVESIPYGWAAAAMQSLPSAGAGTAGGSAMLPGRFEGFPTNLPPPPTLAKRPDQTLQLAGAASVRETGLVMDYGLWTDPPSSLAGDTTYLVSAPYMFSGTIEGGTVVKIADGEGWYGWGNGLILGCNPVCATGPNNMAIFTSPDDDSVGVTIPGSTGQPTVGTANMYFSGGCEDAPTLKYLRIAYANVAFNTLGNGFELWDSQFFFCNFGILNCSVNLHNVLLAMVWFPVAGSVWAPSQLSGEQVSAVCYDFTDQWSSASLVNSLVSYWDSLGNCTTSFSQTGYLFNPPWQTAGGGSFYLADNTYRGHGTTSISAAMLAELQNKTTYPPTLLTGTLTTPTTLVPQVQRNTGNPDLGYHYDPLDYLATCDVSGTSLTLLNGVVVGYYGTGVSLQDASHLVSQGGPTQRNVLVYGSEVQEWPGGCSSTSVPIASAPNNPSQNPSISLNFTSLYAPAGTQSTIDTTGSHRVDNFSVLNCETVRWWRRVGLDRQSRRGIYPAKQSFPVRADERQRCRPVERLQQSVSGSGLPRLHLNNR